MTSTKPPARRRALVVVLGIAGRMPFAGMAFQALHYLEGFRRQGCDVVYLEDSGDWPYDARAMRFTDDPSYTVQFVARFTSRIGVPWAYRAPDRALFGMTEEELRSTLSHADALVNLTAGTVLREEHLRVPVRIYLETDPVTPEIRVEEGDDATIAFLSSHTHHFSFGENIGTDRTPLRTGPFSYQPTRQPIVVDWWTPGPFVPPLPSASFTTVGNWRQTGKDVQWRGETYAWSKHLEFLKFVELPQLTGAAFDLALSAITPDEEVFLRSRGWNVQPALPLSLELPPYQDFIRSSLAEFTVAKEQNIRLRSAGFSDRSATYLACGRPVVTQDTGFGDVLPIGEGLFAFLTVEDAVQAIQTVLDDPHRQGIAALEIAREYFDADRVVGRILDHVGL